ncbi:DMT family transporter [Qingshengfaniella alkalisoli]|uniref:DMT family transporter n=1 Tax=Qingshengfaniella alkalisoli TaxID=2599296 RepID=A0A5B8J300_9RHOB|nr:DMT family transporter [Qingshengfaniella alkalisoli]QDY71128.1 DMT family transporter [Qingshengfaniella alkalisoli]
MDDRLAGWASGMVGVAIFSGSLPATRVAVGQFDPLFLTSARAVIAAGLAGLCLALLKQSRPLRSDAISVVIVAVGVVIGFPLLTALALQNMTAAHSIIYIGLLPVSTAVFGMLRGGENPRPAFWVFSLLGAFTVAGFAASQGGSGSVQGDLLMFAAILICGLGYAEGAALSRRLGGWQVISWALMLSLPVMTLLMALTMPTDLKSVTVSGWLSLGYVAVFSMLVGFVFWYRGLALGGIAGVGQLQLMQPFLGLALAGLVLKEPVASSMMICAAVVVMCVAATKRFA